MAMVGDGQGIGRAEEPLKSQFMTREGTYKLMTLSEYSRPNRLPFSGQGSNSGNASVRVSFVSVVDEVEGCLDRICFNVGRELFVYPYKGLKKAADLNKPLDKRVYKGTFPTCHAFEQSTASAESASLIIGFSAGQIQLIDPFKKEVPVSKLYNEERLIDKTRVTCLKWIPTSNKYFLAAHASGNMFLYNEELPCCPSAPSLQLCKQTEDFAVYTCKTKATRNPQCKWAIGEGSINEFGFSYDGKYIAVVSQDGFLRVFDYESMELVGLMRSYFGGLLCVAWSPDSKYIVTGHRSWVSVVAFDPYTTSLGDVDIDLQGSEEDFSSGAAVASAAVRQPSTTSALSAANLCLDASHCGAATRLRYSFRSGNAKKSSASNLSLTAAANMACYRFGSVGHDAMLCLWDLTEDVLKQPPPGRLRMSTAFANATQGHSTQHSLLPVTLSANVTDDVLGDIVKSRLSAESVAASKLLAADASAPGNAQLSSAAAADRMEHSPVDVASAERSIATRLNPLIVAKQPRKAFSIGNRSSGKGAAQHQGGRTAAFVGSLNPGGLIGSVGKSPLTDLDQNVRHFASTVCPRLDDVGFIEPLITKKIAHERLTVLIFREDCIVTACQEGFICTWARPGRAGLSQQRVNSPTIINSSSLHVIPGGTIV